MKRRRLDSKYVLVKVGWNMRFERGTGDAAASQNYTTYVLSQTSVSFQIVFQFDHQNLRKLVQELGLK